ncbi:hypothetical protein K8S17_00940 [bacterium]|nr:hypothetical protein [bacterium]
MHRTRTGLRGFAPPAALGAACALALLALAVASGCTDTVGPGEQLTREELIPAGAVKVTPDTDVFVPVVHLAEWADPVPMPGTINTAGGEDSPFISPDGEMFLFWWTPDVSIPAEQQVGDGGTGNWVALPASAGGLRVRDGEPVRTLWDEPEFIVLSDVPSLEGCPTLDGATLWFCAIRAGNYGEHDVWLADYHAAGQWTNWRNAGETLNLDYDIGEWHLLEGGTTLIFGSDRSGGYGDMDLWSTWFNEGDWSVPENLGPNVNDAGHQSRPFVTPEGDELWFTGNSGLGYHGPAVFRCIKQGADWGPAEEIISNYAGEPCLDDEGNIYFTHHFMDAGEEMIEADIYVCYKR